MTFKGKKEAKRLEKILKGYEPGEDPVTATHSFVKELLNPQPDRFDIMRVCMIGRSDIGERSAGELIEVCEKRQKTLTDWQDRICGTDTVKAFWEEKLQMRSRFYEALQVKLNLKK